MRRLIITIVTLFILISSFAFQSALADVDLSGMSFDELVALRNQIDQAIWASDGWQEVSVPAGVYHIGEDIPAGKWTIRPADGHTAEVSYGPSLEDGGASINRGYGYEQITSPNDSYSKYNDIDCVNWTLEDGAYIMIESSSVVFTPFSGNAFSFK